MDYGGGLFPDAMGYLTGGATPVVEEIYQDQAFDDRGIAISRLLYVCFFYHADTP